jgi:hypothetical protein
MLEWVVQMDDSEKKVAEFKEPCIRAAGATENKEHDEGRWGE